MKKWRELSFASGLLLTIATGADATPVSTGDPYEMGCKLYQARNYRQAAQMFETAMRVNPGHSSALYYDALCYQQLGEHEHARALHQHVLNIFPVSPAAALAQKAIAKLGPAATGPTAAATRPASPAPAGPPAEVAVIDADLASAATNISNNRDALAERSFLDAERHAEKLGSNHPKLGQVMGAIGDYWVGKGETEKAIRAFRKEMQIKERILDRSSPELADCMLRQAPTYISDGLPDEAERYLTRCIDIYQKAYDSDERNHKNSKANKDKLVGSMAQMANCYRKQTRFSDAKMMDAQVARLNAQ